MRSVYRRGLLLVGALLPAALAVGCDHSGPTPPAAKPSAALTVTSPAFTEGATIPADYTCAGAGNRPALAWSGPAAPAYAIVVLDPDAPSGNYYHWIVVDLPAGTTGVDATIPPGARELKNTAGDPKWTPPCPPSGTHHYRFTVYALSEPTKATSVDDAFAAIERTTVAAGTLTGLVSH